jgi:serine/threonine-protein kinase
MCGAEIVPGTAPTVQVAPTIDESNPESAWSNVLDQLRRATRGRYEIDRELGHGGMAAVYLAHEIALDRKVAIKVMSPAILMQHGMVERFRQEAVTIASLKHPNIITVHAVEHHDQLHFFVLEFVEGRSLETIVEGYGPLAVPVARAWLAQIASALDYAHRRGVIHRDIKPANTLVDLDGNAIVTDFGIAKVEEKPGFTMTGAVIGTPAYMSPEQCLGKPVTGASDQYSLGVLGYEMLTGTPPFDGATLTVMQAHTMDMPPPITERRAECPPELADAVMRMLRKDPEERWPRLSDAVTAFGSPPGPDDPVRRQMSALSTGDEPTALVAPVSTPVTPLPRAEVGAAGRRGFKSPKLWMGGGAVFAAGIALWILAPVFLPSDASLGSVTLAPTSATLAMGETAELQAVARNAADSILTDVAIEWTSSDTAIATVSNGVVVARAPGTVTINAAGGGQSAAAEFTVTGAAEAVASIALSPSAVRLGVGETTRLTVSVLGPGGTTLTGHVPAWRSDNTAVATVSSDGTVTARAAGTVEITAESEGFSARATVTVVAEIAAVALVRISPASVSLEVGQTRDLVAEPRDAQGNRLGGRRITWQVSDPAVASVSREGRLAALAPGTTSVTGTVEGFTGTAAITVTPESVASITVVPSLLPLEAGQRATLAATLVGSSGRALADRPLSWRSSDPGVVSVSDQGVVTAVGPGTAVITAISAAQTGQATVTVSALVRETPVLDRGAAVAVIGRRIPTFVDALNAAARDRDIAALRSAYGIPLLPTDEEYWQTMLGTDDFRDHRIELIRTFEPEQVGDLWRVDFDATLTFRASRGDEEVAISFRAEFRSLPNDLELTGLRMRTQR